MTGESPHAVGGAAGVSGLLKRERGLIFQGFSRVMSRPTGRVIRLLDSRRSSRVGSGGLTERFGSGQEALKASRVGSGRAGSA